MVSNLFLLGTIGVGKSTMIRECLMPYLPETGGFFVQRIFIGSEYAAFRLCPVDSFPGYELDCHVETLEGLNNLFLYSLSGNNWQRNLEVFEKAGLDCLEKSLRKNKKLILMDELGGVELYSKVFTGKVKEVISAEVPVLGVAKNPANSRVLENSLAGRGVIDTNSQFLQYLGSHPSTELMTVTRENRLEASIRLKSFIEGVFY